MTVLLTIAILWVVCGVACWATLWLQNRRPLSETDRVCARIDRALRHQYGAAPSLFR